MTLLNVASASPQPYRSVSFLTEDQSASRDVFCAAALLSHGATARGRGWFLSSCCAQALRSNVPAVCDQQDRSTSVTPVVQVPFSVEPLNRLSGCVDCAFQYITVSLHAHACEPPPAHPAASALSIVPVLCTAADCLLKLSNPSHGVHTLKPTAGMLCA